MDKLVKKITRVLSVIVVLLLVISVTSVFKLFKNSPAAETETTTQEVSGETTVEDTTAPAETTAAVETTAEGETTTEGQTTAQNETTTLGQTTVKPDAKPTTMEEIVAYYNAAANKVRKDKPGFTKVNQAEIGEITSPSSTIQGIAKAVIPMFSGAQKPTTTTVNKGGSGDFPVKGQSYGSKLQASYLSSATCKDKGSYYEITMKFKDEKLADLPADPAKTRHGSAMNVLSAAEVYDQTDKFKSIVKVTKFAPTYSGSYIECTIDKATGNMKSVTFYFRTIANVVAKPLVGTIEASVPFAIRDTYTLKY